MARRTRVDSLEAAKEIAASAHKDIKPPTHVELSESDMPFFNSVIAEFAKSEWSDHQLELAAMLARSMCDLDREQKALREEGSVSKSDRGTPVINPRKTVVQMLSGTILSMRRSLCLHARAQNPKDDNAKIAKRLRDAKDIEAGVIGGGDVEELFAQPTYQ